jgi:hypothetical protein
MPKTLSSVGEAITTFMGIVGSAKESLNKIIVRGEYDEYLENETFKIPSSFYDSQQPSQLL